jgi:hypothetical protein
MSERVRGWLRDPPPVPNWLWYLQSLLLIAVSILLFTQT